MKKYEKDFCASLRKSAAKIRSFFLSAKFLDGKMKKALQGALCGVVLAGLCFALSAVAMNQGASGSTEWFRSLPAC